MKDKYYTPEISEFHVGFEFEFYDFDDDDWTPVIIKTQSELCHWTAFHNIGKRVKHLDREDIESFGFEFVKKGWGEKSKVFRSSRGMGSEILYVGIGPLCEIKSNGQLRFEGDIKNKSELRRILTQIGAI